MMRHSVWNDSYKVVIDHLKNQLVLICIVFSLKKRFKKLLNLQKKKKNVSNDVRVAYVLHFRFLLALQDQTFINVQLKVKVKVESECLGNRKQSKICTLCSYVHYHLL